jgi:hypothetical protein
MWIVFISCGVELNGLIVDDDGMEFFPDDGWFLILLLLLLLLLLGRLASLLRLERMQRFFYLDYVFVNLTRYSIAAGDARLHVPRNSKG